MSEPAPTVFVVDDDASFLRSIARWLRAHGYAVECYSSAVDFLARRPVQAVGCAVIDLQMPGMNGMSLQKAVGESDYPLPVVFLTGHGDVQTGVAAMRGGAEDFVDKTAPKDILLAAIQRAVARDARERKARSRRSNLLMRLAKLTPREKEVLAHVLCGLLNKQIAARLGVDERTVKRHRTNMMRKLDVESVVELAQLFVIAGITHDMRVPIDVLAQLTAHS